jgi:DNA mismatch repair ATPase MutS
VFQFYSEKKVAYTQQANSFTQRYDWFSWVRLGIFFVAIGIFIFIASQSWIWAIGFAFLFLFFFTQFVFWHLSLKKQSAYYQRLAEINQKELQLLDFDFCTFDKGEDFLHSEHPYSTDLDIFGNYSFFQYTNRTSTTLGRQHLATMLSQPAPYAEIIERQTALQELATKTTWRQHFQAIGATTTTQNKHLHLLLRWLEMPNFVLNNRWLNLALYILPCISIFGTLYVTFNGLGTVAELLVLLPAGYTLARCAGKTTETHQYTTEAQEILTQYSSLIKCIETETMTTPKLVRLKEALLQDKSLASTKIQRLAYIITQLNVRFNVFAIVLNLFGLWELQWVYRLEQWKDANNLHLAAWFATLQEFDALISLAATVQNNPDWTFPTIEVEGNVIESDALGHPLIPTQRRVSNSFSSPTQGHLKLLTGSNMAGKSTFLRTVGLNIVLSMTGMSVCARRMTLPILQVYTSMRTQDDLGESTSAFYAELKRLKTVIEAVEQQQHCYFLLDEILKGTNSTDRHTGSKALIQQLIQTKGAGIVATHDLELGSMEATANGTIENLCMEVAVQDYHLAFDYTVYKGVSKSFNATYLMREMGIKV